MTVDRFTVPGDTRRDSQKLDPQQEAVVRSPIGPLLVVAGAGTGKTRALVHRVAALVEGGADPGHIMLCTFTNRAAQDMLSRVETLIHMPIDELWAGTFHHIANRLMRTYGPRAGFPTDYVILDRGDAEKLMAGCLGDGRRQGLPAGPTVLSILSRAVSLRRSIEQTVVDAFGRFADRIGGIVTAIACYQQAKGRVRGVDYDDLLLGWHALMTRDASLADEIAQRFLHVLVDEYQDVSPIQAELVDLVATRGHGSITVVGDDAQSIYGFRGASVDVMLDFPRRYPDAEVLRLETNYRSTPQILALANRSMEGNQRRIPKTLSAVRDDGRFPVVVRLDDPNAQARFVCQRVMELHRTEGLALRDMAVLYRFRAHKQELEMELERRGVLFMTVERIPDGSESSAGGIGTDAPDGTSRPDQGPQSRLVLSTIHQAKGLEWKVVFILWLSEGAFPSVPTLTSVQSEEEERRVFHVAVTRAKDEVYLCYPSTSVLASGERRPLRISRFLTELQPGAPYETWQVLATDSVPDRR